MPIRNAHWMNQNEGRAYPVDDGASAVSDGGVHLPPDIVSDLNLRWPSTLGDYAFLAAVSVTDALVTLTIQASTDPAEAVGLVPLAVLSVRRPVTEGRMYALLAQAPGVGGWLAFGSGANGGRFAGRFSSPAQSRLTPRAARAYRPPPVLGVQALGAAARLSGVVTLKATPPLALAAEERVIDGVLRDCIVVRLVEPTTGVQIPAAAAAVLGTATDSVFKQFSGPCAGRPESNTCGCPAPLEFVNAVAPDCDGKVTVEFRGHVAVSRLADGTGAAVDCPLGLVDACIPPQIPDSDGRLPGEYEPTNTTPPPDPVGPDASATSDSFSTDGTLPLVACFQAPDAVPLTTTAGLWQWTDDDTPDPLCEADMVGVSESVSVSASHSELQLVGYTRLPGSYATASAAGRNAAVWDADVASVFRRVETVVKLTLGPAGAKQNAALVLNHRPHPTTAGRVVYYTAEVDYDAQEFRIARFTGTAFQAVAAVPVPGLQVGKWYRIVARVTPADETRTRIAAELTSVSDPETVSAAVAAVVSSYRPSTGKFGLGTNRALAAFSYLRVEAEGV